MTVDSTRESRDFLLRSIRDLDAEYAAGDITEDDYRRLRDDYVARAAAAIRGDDAPSAPVAGPRARRWLLPAALALAVAAGAGWAVARSADQRLSGDAATGSIELTGGDRITRAQELVSEGRAVEALKLYDAVLDDDPENPVALAQRGWLLAQAELVDEGLASIDRAIAADPSYPDAHFFRGMVLWRAKGDTTGASESFRAVLASDPPPAVRQAATAALQQLGQSTAG